MALNSAPIIDEVTCLVLGFINHIGMDSSHITIPQGQLNQALVVDKEGAFLSIRNQMCPAPIWLQSHLAQLQKALE